MGKGSLQKSIDSLLDRDFTRKEFIGLIGVAVASLTGITGLIKTLESHAATATASIEPESGTLSSNVSSVSDSTASGTHAVKFGTTSSGITDAQLATLIASVPPSGTCSAPSGTMYGSDSFDKGIVPNNEIWDNFDGTTLDSRLWLKDTINQGGTQTYQTDHMYLDGSSHAVNHATASGTAYTSGRFTSRTKFNMLNGWIAASIKMPESKNGVGLGWFTAFWLLMINYNSNPPYAEFDLMEIFGDSTTYSTHFYTDGNATNEPAIYKPVPSNQGSDCALGYHTYWCLREPNRIRVGVDSLIMVDMRDTDFTSGVWASHMQQPMYFINNFAVAPSWLPAPKASDFPADMLTDWMWYKPLALL